jgi:hypothetical protein
MLVPRDKSRQRANASGRWSGLGAAWRQEPTAMKTIKKTLHQTPYPIETVDDREQNNNLRHIACWLG